MKQLLFYTISFCLAACYSKPGRHELSKIAKLPAFKIISLDSSKCVSTDDLDPQSPMLFIYFGPNCEICQQETRELLSHLNQLKHVDIYMIANESTELSKKFYQTFSLDTAKNIFVGTDYEYSFYKIYFPQNIPYVAIYDSHKNLKRIYKEKPSITSIISLVHK